MLRWILAGLLAFAGPAAPAAGQDSLDTVATDYSVLLLKVEKFAPDLISAPAPPAPLVKLAAASDRIDQASAVDGLQRIVQRIDRLPKPTDPLVAMRQRSLRAHAVSLEFQLRPKNTPRLPVAEQVRLLFGFDPVFPSLESYDPAIERLDKVMPGEGSLSERIERMKNAAIVPKDRVEPVVRAAMAECRKRVATHLNLPTESVELRFLDDPLVPGEMRYAGNGKSIVSISTAVPADVDRLLGLACHEVYPGHHTNLTTLDERLAQGLGWPEIAVTLADSPQFPVSDAISEYGIGLTFPVTDRIAFERDVLYPLAGLRMRDEAAWRAYIEARSSVLGATTTVIRDYLDRRIDAETAKALFIKYRLQNRRSAEQMIKMLDAFGPFPIASDAGWFTIDRALAGKSLADQWRLLARIESEPMLLDDIRALR